MVRFEITNHEIDPNDVYITVRSAYHRHFTHDPSEGLRCVKAPDIRTAANQIALQFVEWVRDEATERSESQTPYSRSVMNRLGMIRYGKVFLERYRDYLDDHTYHGISETLKAAETFINERMTFENTDISTDLSSNVENMTWIVIAFTCFSALITLASYIESVWTDQTLPQAILVVASLVAPLYVIRRLHGPRMTELLKSTRVFSWLQNKLVR